MSFFLALIIIPLLILSKIESIVPALFIDIDLITHSRFFGFTYYVLNLYEGLFKT